MEKKTTITFAGFLIIVLALIFLFDHDIDAHYTQNAFLCGDDCIDGFRYPLLYYITIPFYFLFGKLAFTILPLLLFFSAIAFLIKTIKLTGASPYWTIIFFCSMFLTGIFIVYYTRDSLNFLLSSAFAYFFFSTYYHQKKLWSLTITTGLMFFANPHAIIFLAFFVWAAIKRLIPARIFASVVLPFSIIQKELLYIYNTALSYLFQFSFDKAWYFILPLNNYFNIISITCFLANPKKLFAAILLAEFFVAGTATLVINSLYPDPDPQQLAIRYGLEFLPMQYYFVAQTVKQRGIEK